MDRCHPGLHRVQPEERQTRYQTLIDEGLAIAARDHASAPTRFGASAQGSRVFELPEACRHRLKRRREHLAVAGKVALLFGDVGVVLRDEG